MFAELKMFALLLAVVWILPINSMDISGVTPGPCPANIVTVQDLNMEQFAGHWNEHSGYWFIPDPGCRHQDITLLSNGSVSLTFGSTFNPDGWFSIHCRGNVASPGKLKISPDILPVIAVDYWILGTDYENYAVTYTCLEYKHKHHISLSILMRQQTLSEEAIRAAHAVLINNALSLDYLSVRDRPNCD